MKIIGPDDDEKDLVFDAVLFIVGLVGFICLISLFYSAIK